jgi:hypothetical protein
VLSSSGCALPIVSGFSFGSVKYFAHRRAAEEEQSQRRGCSSHVTNTIPPCLHISDATTVPNTADDTVAPVRDPPPTLPTPGESSCNPVQLSSNNVLQDSLTAGDSSQPASDSTIGNTLQPSSPPLVDVDARHQPPPPLAVATEDGPPTTEDTPRTEDGPRIPPPAATTEDMPQPSSSPVAEDTPRAPSPHVTEDMPQAPSPHIAEDTPRASSGPAPVIASQQPENEIPPPTPAELTHNDPAPTTSNAEESTTGSLPLGVFMFDTPSTFVTSSTLKYWETVPGGQRWIDMVKAYLWLEGLPAPLGVRIYFYLYLSIVR